MAQKSRRKLDNGKQSGYSRNYVWGSQTLRSMSNVLIILLLLGVVVGVVFQKQLGVPLKHVLTIALFLLGLNEWIRAFDNKGKGGPKKFTISFFALGGFMMAFGVAALLMF